jgi:hypothetical protein
LQAVLVVVLQLVVVVEQVDIELLLVFLSQHQQAIQ